MTFNAGIEAAALKPCPFCGSGPAKRSFDGTSFSGVEMMDSGEWHHVWCGTCGNRTSDFIDQSSAIEAWNTRPSSSAPVEQREAVRQAVRNVVNAPMLEDQPRKSLADRIADAILSLPGSSRDEVRCLFCRKTIGDDDEAITDDNGEIACKACGESEFKAQAEEAHESALKSGVAK